MSRSTLGGKLGNEKREAGNVASGMREALGEPHRYDVLRQRHHDRHVDVTPRAA